MSLRKEASVSKGAEDEIAAGQDQAADHDELNVLTFPCAFCKKDTSLVSSFTCVSCESSRVYNLCCSFHARIGHEVKSSRGFDVTLCKEHLLVVSNYCSDCRTVLCERCVVEQHSKHTFTTLQERAKVTRGGMFSLVSSLEEKQKVISSVKLNVIETCKTGIENARRKIREDVSTAHELVDAHAARQQCFLDSIAKYYDTIDVQMDLRQKEIDATFHCLRNAMSCDDVILINYYDVNYAPFAEKLCEKTMWDSPHGLFETIYNSCINSVDRSFSDVFSDIFICTASYQLDNLKNDSKVDGYIGGYIFASWEQLFFVSSDLTRMRVLSENLCSHAHIGENVFIQKLSDVESPISKIFLADGQCDELQTSCDNLTSFQEYLVWVNNSEILGLVDPTIRLHFQKTNDDQLVSTRDVSVKIDTGATCEKVSTDCIFSGNGRIGLSVRLTYEDTSSRRISITDQLPVTLDVGSCVVELFRNIEIPGEMLKSFYTRSIEFVGENHIAVLFDSRLNEDDVYDTPLPLLTCDLRCDEPKWRRLQTPFVEAFDFTVVDTRDNMAQLLVLGHQKDSPISLYRIFISI